MNKTLFSRVYTFKANAGLPKLGAARRLSCGEEGYEYRQQHAYLDSIKAILL